MSRPEEQAAFDKAFELATRLGEMMQTALAERGLTTARAQVIFRLHHAGPLVQRRLSEELRCSPRQVTALIDALEETGFVERRPHPTDRRATVVSLSEQGTKEAERMDAERAESAAVLLGDTPTRQLSAFIAVTDHFISQIDRRAGSPTWSGY
ncbi:MAG: MarR family winged helix-turn-helix transcriptional regulator [Haloechinothrix sp.]